LRSMPGRYFAAQPFVRSNVGQQPERHADYYIFEPIFRVTWNSSSLPSAILPLCETTSNQSMCWTLFDASLIATFTASAKLTNEVPTSSIILYVPGMACSSFPLSIYCRRGAGFQSDPFGPGVSRGVNLHVLAELVCRGRGGSGSVAELAQIFRRGRQKGKHQQPGRSHQSHRKPTEKSQAKWLAPLRRSSYHET